MDISGNLLCDFSANRIVEVDRCTPDNNRLRNQRLRLFIFTDWIFATYRSQKYIFMLVYVSGKACHRHVTLTITGFATNGCGFLFSRIELLRPTGAVKQAAPSLLHVHPVSVGTDGNATGAKMRLCRKTAASAGSITVSKLPAKGSTFQILVQKSWFRAHPETCAENQNAIFPGCAEATAPNPCQSESITTALQMQIRSAKIWQPCNHTGKMGK